MHTRQSSREHRMKPKPKTASPENLNFFTASRKPTISLSDKGVAGHDRRVA